MANQEMLEKLRQRRIERMRLGQETAELEPIPSDPEFRVALVPLLEKEYDASQRAVSLLDVPETVAGATILDRQEKREILIRAIRDPEDLTSKLFSSVNEMMELLEPVDITHLYDKFVEMSMDISPDLRALSQEEIDFLKRVFESFSWSDLSGRQHYALNRFLLTLSPDQLMGRQPGSFSMNS